MKLQIGDLVRYNGKGLLMTVAKFLPNNKAVCVWFRGPACQRRAFDCGCLVKDLPLTSFTVEVCTPSRCSWKRCKISTYITTARTSHEARRKILQMLLDKKKRVLSTQVVDRYPKGV